MTSRWLDRCDPALDEILERGLLRTLFQPLVHLESGSLSAFEALTRGPAGTSLESPLALLDAARSVGRLAELDRACRTNALAAAAGAGLPTELGWFVNVEPEAVTDGDLLDVASPRPWRIVVELTERALARDPRRLMAAVDTARSLGLGVALDDVGAEPASLAFLPLVRPDVVKLDMGLIAQQSDPAVAVVVAAVRAYAESSGAHILAEGIESSEHVMAAQCLGATYGQGWWFGRPDALPAMVPPPHAAFTTLSSSGSATGTPFSIVTRTRPTAVAPKSMLMPMSRHLEDAAVQLGAPAVVIGCFQNQRFFTARIADRYAELARSATFVGAIGEGMGAAPAPGVRGAALSSDDPLCGEWNVLVLGPHYAAALVAQDLGDDGPDRDRRFVYTVTHDRDLVVRAVRALMDVIIAS